MQSTIASTYGAALVGCIIAAFFYGITCAQTCFYNMTFLDDSKTLRSLVNVLWLLDTIHLSCVISTMYFFLIANRNNLIPGASSVWTDGALIIISNISDFLVRCIFIYRIYSLTGRRAIVLGIFGTLVVVSAGFGIFYGVVTISHPPSVLSKTLSFSVYTGLAASAASDFVISATLCSVFSHLAHEVQTAYPLLNKLRLFAIQAGVLPSAVALTSLVTYIIYPTTFMYMGVFFVLPKATLNSMLAMLNARKSLRQVLPSAKFKMRISVEQLPNGGLRLSQPPVSAPPRWNAQGLGQSAV